MSPSTVNKSELWRILRVACRHMTPSQRNKLRQLFDCIPPSSLNQALADLQCAHGTVVLEAPAGPDWDVEPATMERTCKRRVKRAHPSWNYLSSTLTTIEELSGHLVDKRLSQCWDWATAAKPMYSMCRELYLSLHDLLYERDTAGHSHSKLRAVSFTEPCIRSITNPSLLYAPRTRVDINSVNSLIKKVKKCCDQLIEQTESINLVLASDGMHQENALLIQLRGNVQAMNAQLEEFDVADSRSLGAKRAAELDGYLSLVRRYYIDLTGATDRFDSRTFRPDRDGTSWTTGCFYGLALALAHHVGIKANSTLIRASITRILTQESHLALMYQLVVGLCHKQFDPHQIRIRRQRLMRMEKMSKDDLALLQADLQVTVSSTELAEQLMDRISQMGLMHKGMPITLEHVASAIESHYDYRESLKLNAA